MNAVTDVPFGEIGDATQLAPETPLTEEAVVHLRAAGREIDRGHDKLRSLLTIVRREIHPWVVGDDVTLEEDQAYCLSNLLEMAMDLADREVVRPVFERGRGLRDHGGIPSAEGAA